MYMPVPHHHNTDASPQHTQVEGFARAKLHEATTPPPPHTHTPPTNTHTTNTTNTTTAAAVTGDNSQGTTQGASRGTSTTAPAPDPQHTQEQQNAAPCTQVTQEQRDAAAAACDLFCVLSVRALGLQRGLLQELLGAYGKAPPAARYERRGESVFWGGGA